MFTSKKSEPGACVSECVRKSDRNTNRRKFEIQLNLKEKICQRDDFAAASSHKLHTLTKRV